MRSKRRGRSEGTGDGGGPELHSPCGILKTSRRWLAALALTAAALALGPASASAAPARYVYEVCDSALPGGGDTGVHFSVNPGVPFAPNDTCAQPGGGLSITETGNVSYSYSFWSIPLASPPGGSTESTTISGASCRNTGNIKAFVFEQEFPSYCAAESQHIFYGGGFGGIWIFLGCTLGSGSCGAGSWIYAHYFAATEVDPVAPTLSGLAGTLLSGGVIRGHQDLSVEAHDKGGGLSDVSVSVNGLPAAQPNVPNCNLTQVKNPSVVGTVAVSVTPCPTSVKSDWTLDTQAYPFHDGANAVQVCASDFATLSDPNTTCSTQTVNVDNSCAASSVPGGEVLSAQFAESNSDTVTVGYGKGAEVTGRLADNAGDPVPGATLCVKMQTTGIDPRPLPVGTVKTDANGAYTYQVPPGPNRDVAIGYRHDASQVVRDVRYYAHAQPSLRVTPRKLENGHRVRLSGQVPGPGGGGRVVILQANVPGSKRWITFRKATTDAEGAFHSGYRFNSTTRSTTYRFRAVVPAQAGYPWVEGNSPAAKVVVKG